VGERRDSVATLKSLNSAVQSAELEGNEITLDNAMPPNIYPPNKSKN
jgi:hypothetical protein